MIPMAPFQWRYDRAILLLPGLLYQPEFAVIASDRVGQHGGAARKFRQNSRYPLSGCSFQVGRSSSTAARRLPTNR
jgi:hypothetical protein